MHPGVQSEVHPRSPLQLLLKLTCLVFWTKKKTALHFCKAASIYALISVPS